MCPRRNCTRGLRCHSPFTNTEYGKVWAWLYRGNIEGSKKGQSMRLYRFSIAPLFWVLLVSIAAAQDSPPPAHLVHDWSNRHIVFAGLTPENLAEAVGVDPRAWHSWVNHERHRLEPRTDPDPRPIHKGRRHHKQL